jgi:hypothetical protein
MSLFSPRLAHVIAFFVPGDGQCNVQAVIWNADDMEANSAGGVRLSLNASQTATAPRPRPLPSSAVPTLRRLRPSIPASVALKTLELEGFQGQAGDGLNKGALLLPGEDLLFVTEAFRKSFERTEKAELGH